MPSYRQGPEQAPRAAPGEGAVADMVRQFADPYAFVRELVQNGLDAGATRIRVRVDASDGVVATSVMDDGVGMTRAMIEGPLLTLFVSSKEEDTSKIGKYGVGFVSVFALDPDEVTVETWRDGEAWIVRLKPDHSYELEHGEPRPGSGTIVSLLNRVESLGFAAHVASTERALQRWCRHAEKPIELILLAGDGGEPRRVRIDAPLAVHASVSVRETIDGSTYVVGCAVGAEYLPIVYPTAPHLAETLHFAGFYNRGLTLYETGEEAFPGLAAVRFKIVSTDLSHTLSRDNIRRDAALTRALDVTRDIVSGALRLELVRELARRAEIASSGAVEPYLAALAAAIAPPYELGAKHLVFPLVSPALATRSMTAAALKRDRSRGEPCLVSVRPNRIAEALARVGRPVVFAPAPMVARALADAGNDEQAAPEQLYVLADEITELSDVDRVLLDEVTASLGAAGVPAARVGLAAFEGAAFQESAIAAPSGSRTPHLVRVSDARQAAKGGLEDCVVLLRATDEAVRHARASTLAEVRRRGHLLGRLLLVEMRGALSSRENERILEAALAGSE